MNELTLFTTMAVLGIRTRYWLILLAAIVVVVVLVAVMSTRRRGPAFEMRDLDPADAERYTQEFTSIEADFVDHPEQSAARARGIAEEVMRRRGFPDRIEPPQRIRDLARVDRQAATALEAANADLLKGAGDTERLRRAVQDYRTVVLRLTGRPGDREAAA